MKTQHPNIYQYLNDILNILLQRISGDFMNTQDRQHIDFISFNVKRPNIYTHTHFQTVVEYAFSESTFAGLAWLQYQTELIIGYVIRAFRYSYFNLLNKIVLT